PAALEKTTSTRGGAPVPLTSGHLGSWSSNWRYVASSGVTSGSETVEHNLKVTRVSTRDSGTSTSAAKFSAVARKVRRELGSGPTRTSPSASMTQSGVSNPARAGWGSNCSSGRRARSTEAWRRLEKPTTTPQDSNPRGSGGTTLTVAAKGLVSS